MLDIFYDKTCTIQRPTVSKVGGSTKKSFRTIYTTIPCAFWAVKGGNYNQGAAALESNQRNYTANVNGDTTNVKAGDILTLFEVDGENIGRYIIEDVVKYPDINGDIDNVSLAIKIRDG